MRDYRSFTNRRHASLLGLCLAALVSGCMNDPMWRFDRYEVRGVFEGSTCRLWIDGKPISMDTLPFPRAATDTGPRPSAMLLLIDYAYGVGLPPGQGLKTMSCNNVLISIHSPIDTLPSRGEYRVTTDYDYPPRSASASVSAESISQGLWPFAFGVYLDGYEGVVRLDSMDRKRVWAKFEFRGRRQHTGL